MRHIGQHGLASRVKSLLFTLLFCCLASVAGMAQDQPQQPQQVPRPLPPTPEYVQPQTIKARIDLNTHQLAAGDVLEFGIDGITNKQNRLQSEVQTSFPIRADGCVELPYAGNLRAAGLTIPELREKIYSKLKQKLRNPNFRLGILSVTPLQVVVLGEVSRPGRYEIAPGSGVREALACAGGFGSAADQSKVLVTSGANTINHPVLQPYQPGYMNVPLKNGDIITAVPGRKINVIGDVYKVGSYAIPAETGKVSDALLAAGGAKPTAALSRCVVYRPVTAQSFPVDLTMVSYPEAPGGVKPSSEAAQNLQLQEGDTLIVPPRQAIVFADKPSTFPLMGGETILDVITKTGTKVNYDNIQLMRQGQPKPEQVNLTKYFENQDRSVLVPVNDGDIVILEVPTQGFAGNMMNNVGQQLLNPLNLLWMLRGF